MEESKISDVVKIYDYYDFYDGFFKELNSFRKKTPDNIVEMYEVDENGKENLVYRTHNLVVYNGRQLAASRMFNTNNENITATASEFIYWVGLGTGGCPVGDPLSPTSPTNSDTDLENSIGISTDSTCADFLDPYYYKKPIDSVEFEEDENNSNSYLITKVTITIQGGEANGNNINELGLFAAASNEGGYSGNFTLYARVTFPSLVKTSSKIYRFIWYLFF